MKKFSKVVIILIVLCISVLYIHNTIIDPPIPIHSLPKITMQEAHIKYKNITYIMILQDIKPSTLEKKIDVTDDKRYNVYKIRGIDTKEAIGILFNVKNPTIYFKATSN